MSFHRIDLLGKEVDTWLGIKELALCNFVSINLRSNELRDFEHFGTHPYLLELHLQDNNIQNFYGLTKQRSLKVLNLKGNPLASHPFYRIMALMVVGYSVTMIDGVTVTEEEYEIARRTKPQAAVAVSYGWLFDVRSYSTAVLNDIIGECKRAQKERKRKLQPKTSIVNALEGLLFPQTADSLQRKKETIEPIKKTDVIQRLTRRITELEKEVQATKAKVKKSQSAQETDTAVASTANITTLTSGQLGCISSFTFAENVFMQSNVNAAGFCRVCLQLDAKKLLVLEFLTRDLVFEVPIAKIVCEYQAPNHLFVSDEFGASMDLRFEKKGTLSTFYTALYLLQGKPAPPIKLAAQDRVEESVQNTLTEEPATAGARPASQAAGDMAPKRASVVGAQRSQKSDSVRASTVASELAFKSPKASSSKNGAETPLTFLHSPASSHRSETAVVTGTAGTSQAQTASTVPAPISEPQLPKVEAAAPKPLSRFANFAVSDSSDDDVPVQSKVVTPHETRGSVRESVRDSAPSSVIFREMNRSSIVEAAPQANATAALPTASSILIVPESVKNSFTATVKDSEFSLKFHELSMGDDQVAKPTPAAAAPVPATASAPVPVAAVSGQTGNRGGRFQSLMVDSDSDSD